MKKANDLLIIVYKFISIDSCIIYSTISWLIFCFFFHLFYYQKKIFFCLQVWVQNFGAFLERDQGCLIIDNALAPPAICNQTGNANSENKVASSAVCYLAEHIFLYFAIKLTLNKNKNDVLNIHSLILVQKCNKDDLIFNKK